MGKLVLEYHFDRGGYNYHTKRWATSRKRVPVLVEKDYNPYGNYGAVDTTVSYTHPELPDSWADLEDRLIMMNDREYEEYLYLKSLKCD